MANYSAGTGTVDIIPSLRRFHSTIRSELRGINPEVTVGLTADTKRVTRQIQQATRPRTIQVRVEANTAALKKAEGEVASAEKRMASARDASTDALARLNIAEKQLAETRARGVVKASQIASAELKLAQAKRASAAASNDASNAESALNAARSAARDAKVKLQTDVDTAAATGKLQAFAAKAGARYRLKLGVDLDLTGAEARLATFKATASKLARINAPVDLDTGAALAKLAALSIAGAGIGTGVAAGVGVAGAALAGLPAAIVAVLGPVAALTAGIAGVPAAFKAFSDAENQAAQNATGNAKAQAAAARQVVTAREQVARAYEDASHAQAAAARRVHDAERQVVDAERARLRAQQELTRAVDDARRAQQELAFQVAGGALAERQAVLDLADAQQALEAARAGGASGVSLERAELAYERQALALDEVRARNKDLAADKAASDAAGVRGSEQVVAAQERVADASQGVVDAHQGVRDAQSEAARVQVQAQRSIVDAQRQLVAALADAGTVGAAATDKINAAMAKLSPNAQQFVTDVRALKPEFDAVKLAAQEALFQGLGPAFTDFGRTVLPAMATNLAVVSGAIGGVTKDMLAFLATKQVADQFQQLFAGIAQVVTATGPTLQTFVGLFLDLAVAAMPGIVALVQAIGTVGTALSTALAPLIQSGAITQAVTLIANLFSALAPILAMIVARAVELWTTIGPTLIATIQALTPVISTLLALFVQVAPILAQIVQMVAAALMPVVQALAPVIAALLPVIASLISSGLQILIPLVQAVAEIWLALMPAIEGVAEVIAELVPIIAPLIAQLAAGLMPLVKALAPVIVQLAGVLAQGLASALTTLIPFVLQVVQALLPLIPTVSSIIAQVVEGLLPIFTPLVDAFLSLILAVVPLLPPLLELVSALLPSIIALVGTLMPIITILANLFADVLGGAITLIVVPALKLIAAVVQTVGDIFKWLYDKIIKPIWDGIASVIDTVWNKVIKPIFAAFGSLIEDMGKAWTKLGDTIGGIWSGIKGIVRTGLQVLIDIIWNKGLREVVNLLPGVDLAEYKLPEFAGGGVLPGYAPGRDSVLSVLSPGEAVLVPEFVRMVGPGTIDAWNRMAMGGRARGRGPGFAAGGVVTATTTGAAPEAITIDPAALAALGDVAAAVTAQLGLLVTTIRVELMPAVAAHGQQTVAVATVVTAQWGLITTSVTSSTATQTTALLALQNALAATRTAIAHTADWAVSQFDRIRAAAADPIRWVLQFPVNAGLIAAWNQIDGDFALGRHVNPVAIPFAFGGRVFGAGTSTSDSIDARLSVGEFVIREAIARRIYPFLRALNAGAPEALQATGFATGGLVADTGSQLNAALARGIAFARGQDGKPYIWGGVGPEGYDCSGFMSAITNVLRGEHPHRRLGVAASQPWPGFVPGLSSAWATGFSPTHTAGTLAGINVESGGSPSLVKFGAGAAGADSAQFSGHASLPIVGGRFVPGGGGVDFSALVGPYFADTYRLVGQITALFAGQLLAAQAAGVTTQATDGVRAAAIAALTALTRVTGTAGSPEVMAAVRSVAARFGWGTGAEWDALSWIIGHESGWNPAAANPTSSARGLFQKMTSVHGPVELTPAGQADWGLNYIRSRYGSPLGAQTHWQRNRWYDRGGVATGVGWMYKGTPEPERVLSPAQTRAFESVVAAVSTGSAPRAGGDTGPAQFTGELRLDSGEFLGVVDGRIEKANDNTASAVTRGIR